MKQMKKIKHRLLEQIRSRGEAPPSFTAANQVERGANLKAADEHFTQCEESLQRVQCAMATWAGALDALAASTQAMAEELARHTMLVTRPTDLSKANSADRAERESAATCCRALQNMMTAVDKTFRPVHAAFVDGALRPLLVESQNEALEVRELREDYRKKIQAHKRGSTMVNTATLGGVNEKRASMALSACNSGDSVDEDSLTLVFNSTGPTTRQGRMEFQERALNEMGEQIVQRVELFRKHRAEKIPEEIGTVLGCQLELSRRFEAEIADLIPLFPHAASAIVEVASAAADLHKEKPRQTTAKERNGEGPNILPPPPPQRALYYASRLSCELKPTDVIAKMDECALFQLSGFGDAYDDRPFEAGEECIEEVLVLQAGEEKEHATDNREQRRRREQNAAKDSQDEQEEDENRHPNSFRRARRAEKTDFFFPGVTCSENLSGLHSQPRSSSKNVGFAMLHEQFRAF